MDNEQVEIIKAAPRHPQVFAVCNQGKKASSAPDSEKITLRLSPARSTVNGLTGREDQPGSLCDSPSCPACGGSLQSREPNGSVAEIDINKLNASDQILIETTHSVYSFTVVDPTIPSGRLIGGVLGNHLVEAALIPSRIESGNAKPTHISLGTGSGFSFLIEWGDNLRRLTTSSVTSLILRKKGGEHSAPVAARGRVRLEHVSNDNSDR